MAAITGLLLMFPCSCWPLLLSSKANTFSPLLSIVLFGWFAIVICDMFAMFWLPA